MLTLADVKTALRIDNEADDAYLDSLMRAAIGYMRNAVDDFDKKMLNEDFEAEADVTELSLIAEAYESRWGEKEVKPGAISRRMLNHLQYFQYGVVDNGEFE